MGWKSVKEHYGIVRTVKVVDDEIHIGSGYIGNLIVISANGDVRHREFSLKSDDLVRVVDEMRADRAKLLKLMAATDTFERSILVYTWDEDRIVEKFCEELEWPNVTHDGDLMHDNRYTTDRAQAIVWALEDAAAGVKIFARHVGEVERDLAVQRGRLDHAEQVLARLEADHGKA